MTVSRRRFVRDMTAGATLLGIGSRKALANPQPEKAARAAGQRTDGRSRVMMIEAKPEPVHFDPARTAIVVVDMQNDFGARGGMFERAGIDISMIERAVAPTARVLAAGRSAGIKVVYLKMAFRPDLSDAGAADAPNRRNHMRLGIGKTVRTPGGAESRILIRDTWNTEILPELTPKAGDSVLYKHRFSGFYETELDAILKRLGVRHLIVTGCTTSVCVESTIRDAMFRDYTCVLLADCTGEPIGHDLPRSNHDASLFIIQTMFGSVSGSAEFVRALEGVPTAPAGHP
jgi:ureidoacrylate peracid hydrolase